METIKLEFLDESAILKLDNGVDNAIGPELAEELSMVLQSVRARARGLVLAGNEKFFSMGFNLPELIQLDRGGVRDFLYTFNAALLDLYTLPLPTAAAFEGHAIAGGTIMGLAADFRIAAANRKLMGLNEIKLGLPVPYLALMLLREVVSHSAVQEIIYHGEFFRAEQALDKGLVDEIVAPGFAEERAVQRIKAIAGYPGDAFRVMKAARVEAVRRKFEKYHAEQHERFLDCWFQPETKALLEAAAGKFKK